MLGDSSSRTLSLHVHPLKRSKDQTPYFEREWEKLQGIDEKKKGGGQFTFVQYEVFCDLGRN